MKNKKPQQKNLLDEIAEEFGAQPKAMYDDQKTIVMHIAEHDVKITITAEIIGY